MNSFDAIGGYFELELHPGRTLHENAVFLNSGRSCLEYILRVRKPSRVYLPKFTCDAMLEPLRKLNVPYVFYSVDDRLELADAIEVKSDELLVYNNYFGLKDSYSLELSRKYGSRLIIDSSQAFYFEPPTTSQTFYSPRKFFGLPDGGLLVSTPALDQELPVDTTSYRRSSHLLKRIDLGPEAGYPDFKRNEASLSGQPLLQMSQLTRRLLSNVDTANAKRVRETNFHYLHQRLGDGNHLHLDFSSPQGPMVYPYLTKDTGLRRHLVDNGVFVATYWPNVLEWAGAGEIEHEFAKNLLPLPIDQRYGTGQMEKLVKLVHEREN